MNDSTKILKKSNRMQRGYDLERGFQSAFLRHGWWCHHIVANPSAPLLDVPILNSKTRAPDLIVFDAENYYLFEIKESLVRNSHVTLYTDQIRDYMHLFDLKFKIIVCASLGDYCGYVGVISLSEINDLVDLEQQNDKILIPEMALNMVGRYRDTKIEFNPAFIHKLFT